MASVGIVGGGIVGLALARQMAATEGVAVTVFEKEVDVGMHQTSHNSGVVHSGVYYRPASLKAELCRRGGALLKEFCEQEALPYRSIGKLVVATDESERVRLDDIEQRARANGVPHVRRISVGELKDLEPNVRGIDALISPTTAIVDFGAVARRLAAGLSGNGHQVLTGHPVETVKAFGRRALVVGADETWEFDKVIVCAGLGTNRLVRHRPRVLDEHPLIVPVRGEYFRLVGASKQLVSRLIYPVPDPRFPFLGIHFTPRVDGNVLLGPNAVVATAMEGYRRSTVSPRDLADLARSGSFWRMARKHWRTGAYELAGSLSRRRYIARAQRYVPSLRVTDVEPAPAGVRAQAISADGEFLDDFAIDRNGPITWLRNAPSPAATSSMAIAEFVQRDLGNG
jgi:L-2-hydroxyglutarate oxidase LhgO